MFGRLIAGLVVVGLAIGVWALWPTGDSGTTSTTAPVAAETTTSPPATTTTTSGTSSTVSEDTLIDTEEEAEEVLRELWFGWFEGIYNQDEERIKEVVASQSKLDAALRAFEVMTFTSPPALKAIRLSDVEILHSNPTCVAIWALLTVDFREGESGGVNVLRQTDTGWKSVSTWVHKNDLWEQDCDALLESLS